jgi:hypothetical protein
MPARGGTAMTIQRINSISTWILGGLAIGGSTIAIWQHYDPWAASISGLIWLCAALVISGGLLIIKLRVERGKK